MEQKGKKVRKRREHGGQKEKMKEKEKNEGKGEKWRKDEEKSGEKKKILEK